MIALNKNNDFFRGRTRGFISRNIAKKNKIESLQPCWFPHRILRFRYYDISEENISSSVSKFYDYNPNVNDNLNPTYTYLRNSATLTVLPLPARHDGKSVGRTMDRKRGSLRLLGLPRGRRVFISHIRPWRQQGINEITAATAAAAATSRQSSQSRPPAADSSAPVLLL